MDASNKVLDILVPVELELKRFVKFQRVIARLSSEFINMPLEKLDDAMKSAMASVGDFCDVFRSSIWVHNWKRRESVRQVGWYKFEPEALEPNYTLPFSAIEPILDGNRLGHVFEIRDANEFFRDTDIAARLSITKPHSLSIFPLLIGSRLVGSLALYSENEHRAYTDMERTTILIFAQMIANIIERKERELELRQHHENDRLILDSINEGVVMFDRDGTIININRHLAERYGGSVQGIIGTRVTEHFSMERYGPFLMNRRDKVMATFDTGLPGSFEDEKDGFTFSNRCFPVYKDGKVCAVALFTTDVTPQKNALEEATKRAEYQARLKVITDFFTNISHEFKTPLTLVFNAEKLIEERVRGVDCEHKAFMSKYLGVIRQNTNRLLRLIGNLLDVTKLDSGFMQVNPQELDVAGWLTMIIESIEDYAANRGIEVTLSVRTPVRSLQTDVDKLERVLLNLLSNAIKHTPRGGHIRVTAGGGARRVVIAVEDDGEGIPEDKKDIIFDRFKQVNTSLTRASEGSGIGLALSRLLVELLGGRIWFASEYGKGSVFYVELPVAQRKGERRASYLDGMGITSKVEMEFSDIL